ncbi:UrcA family protein [Pelagerythrobacter sp.]|uniref:UrcA family protein n=1 Tax=Pelagerythrobacter sp. TaxID=2800702 RepID=UPI0035B3331A
MQRPLIVLAAAVALGTTVPAHAESLAITYRDLDLSTEQGQKTLDQRIDGAVRKYCGMNKRTTGTRMASEDSRRCYAETMKQAKAQFAAVVDEQRVGG